MSDETLKISSRNWDRAIDSINKVGYSDGVVAGQTASFQSSFDMGYEQGFKFGYDVGFQRVSIENRANKNKLLDARKINCQICLNNVTIKDDVINLYNRQLEENKNYCDILFSQRK